MFDPKQFPSLPGVYLMKDGEGHILYVGKAKNLRSRIRQYFIPGRDGREMVPFLTSQIVDIDTIIVTSEKEALILENNLIKKHQPKYNALLKDDRTYFCLMINHKHKWPMLRVVRNKGKPPPGNIYFGPYVNAHAARVTLELLRTLFPLRQCSDRELEIRTRPCILYDMKKCIAPCVGRCSKKEYDKQVERVIHFLKGHDSAVLKDLQKEMVQASDHLEFEKAAQILRTIEAIEKTLETQRVEKTGSIDLDALGLFRENERVVLTQMVFREGKLIASYDRLFSQNAQDDQELLTSFILQHYGEKEELPPLILLPVDLVEKKLLSELFSEEKGRKTTFMVPQKGEKAALVKMAIINAKAKLKIEKELVNAKELILSELEEKLQLTNYPSLIEVFDNSNLGGTETVSAMVVYIDGVKHPAGYRKFIIREADSFDDYGAMREALTRRYRKAREEGILPDLIVIDGGKGHLQVALRVLEDLDVSTVDVISIAKEKGRHDKGMSAEQIFSRYQKEPLILKTNSPLLFFMQQMRDEAHRFAITFQRTRRKKATFSSVFDTLPGIGPVKKKRLLTHFGSLKKILLASPTEWEKVPGITKKDIETLLALQISLKEE